MGVQKGFQGENTRKNCCNLYFNLENKSNIILCLITIIYQQLLNTIWSFVTYQLYVEILSGLDMRHLLFYFYMLSHHHDFTCTIALFYSGNTVLLLQPSTFLALKSFHTLLCNDPKSWKEGYAIDISVTSERSIVTYALHLTVQVLKKISFTGVCIHTVMQDQ